MNLLKQPQTLVVQKSDGCIASPDFSRSMSPIALDIQSACRFSGLGRSSLYKKIQNGEIATRKAGRRRLVLTESLVSYVRSLPIN